jgi:hypothetical protein
VSPAASVHPVSRSRPAIDCGHFEDHAASGVDSLQAKKKRAEAGPRLIMPTAEMMPRRRPGQPHAKKKRAKARFFRIHQ